jgi:hypothetical protein
MSENKPDQSRREGRYALRPDQIQKMDLIEVAGKRGYVLEVSTDSKDFMIKGTVAVVKLFMHESEAELPDVIKLIDSTAEITRDPRYITVHINATNIINKIIKN